MLSFYLPHVCLSKRSFDVTNCVVFPPCRVCRDAAEYYRHKAGPSVHRNPLSLVPKLHPIHPVPKGGGSCHHCVSVGALRGLYSYDPLLSCFPCTIPIIHF